MGGRSAVITFEVFSCQYWDTLIHRGQVVRPQPWPPSSSAGNHNNLPQVQQPLSPWPISSHPLPARSSATISLPKQNLPSPCLIRSYPLAAKSKATHSLLNQQPPTPCPMSSHYFTDPSAPTLFLNNQQQFSSCLIKCHPLSVTLTLTN